MKIDNARGVRNIIGIAVGFFCVVSIAIFLGRGFRSAAVEEHIASFEKRYPSLEKIVEACHADSSIMWVGRGDESPSIYAGKEKNATTDLRIAEIKRLLYEGDLKFALCGRRGDKLEFPLDVVQITVKSQGISVSGWGSGYLYLLGSLTDRNSEKFIEDGIKGGTLFSLSRNGWFVFLTR